MADKGGAYPITKENLARHLENVNYAMKYIKRGGMEEPSLFDLVKGIGGDENIMPPEVQNTLQTVRDGFSLYYEMNSLLEEKVKGINSGIDNKERISFLGAYSMFAGSAYIAHKLNIMTQGEFDNVARKEDYFRFDLGKEDLLNMVLARYYGLINTNKRSGNIKNAIDLPKGSLDFFRFLKEASLAKKETFHHELVDLVNGAQFRVLDEFDISGFEATYEEDMKKTKIEFVPVKPHEVIGNSLAKKEMIRDMDRIALYDPTVKNNPIVVVGGLSPSVLYDGFPGTGKTTLFKVGRTRLQERIDAVNEYWKSKNLKPLPFKWLELTPKVKTKWYGEAGQNTSALVEEAQRPDSYNIFLTDDIDMLFSGGRDDSGSGDKDMMNILMQFSSGVNTAYIGNMQWWGATNEPTALDNALRQRFMAKYEVNGPETDVDYSDLMYLKLKGWIKLGLINIENGKGYTPLEKIETLVKENVNFTDKFSGSSPTLKDLGILAKKFKDENPRFTGRPIQAISEAIAKRINDYEIPEEFYTEPSRFFEKTFDERVGILRDLCRKIDSNIVAEELTRYAQIENRYASEKFDRDVEKAMHHLEVELKARALLSEKLGVKK